MLLLCVCILFYSSWRTRKSRRKIELAFPGKFHLNLPLSVLYSATAIGILLFLHQGAKEWALKSLESQTSPPTVKPKFVSDDQFHLYEAKYAYDRRDYDNSLASFSEIRNLSGREYVKWKFYEGMAYFRKEQFSKSVLMDEVNMESVHAAIKRFEGIMENHDDDPLYSDAKYWCAQAYRYLLGDDDKAYELFQELLSKYPPKSSFRWREGCEYYSAVIEINRGNKEHGIRLLNQLRKNSGNSLIQPIELGRDSYLVSFIVDSYLREL